MPHLTPWRQYLCKACGYIYNEEFGDPDGGLPAGTRFEDIPDTWQCPLCGVSKADLELIKPPQNCPTPFVGLRQTQGVVIVGAGLAGWSMVEALRALDQDLPITLISADSACRYHKPMLSVGFSQKKSANDLIRTLGVTAAQHANIQLLADTFVLDIDTHQKQLHTTRGNIGYDKLILAIGAIPIYPPNISKRQAWHVNHLVCYDKLYQKLSTPKHVAIVGAGMIGVELAEDLCQAGHKVSLIDKNALPLSHLFPAIIGEKIAKSLEHLGVIYYPNAQINHVSHQTPYQIELTQAKQIYDFSVDEIIVATGLRLDTRLPTRAKLKFSQTAGIIVDNQLQTSVADIYALGDCIAIDGKPCRYIAPHRNQATTIAHAITNTPHLGYTHNAPPIRLKNKSISVQATGNPTGTGDWRVLEEQAGKLVMAQYQGDQTLATITLLQKYPTD